MLRITHTGGGRFVLDVAKFRAAIAEEEPHVPTASRQEERPALDIYELVGLARAAGAVTCPEGVGLEVIAIDEIEDSGLIVAVHDGRSQDRGGGHPNAVTGGYVSSGEFLVSDTSELVPVAPTDACRATEAVRRVLGEANAVLEHADASALAAEVREALEGDSGDAEHDALVSAAEALGIEYGHDLEAL